MLVDFARVYDVGMVVPSSLSKACYVKGFVWLPVGEYCCGSLGWISYIHISSRCLGIRMGLSGCVFVDISMVHGVVPIHYEVARVERSDVKCCH